LLHTFARAALARGPGRADRVFEIAL